MFGPSPLGNWYNKWIPWIYISFENIMKYPRMLWIEHKVNGNISNSRSQDDSKSRFKPKFLRAKFRDSKTWGKKSISNSEEKEQSSSTNGIPSDTSNGYFQSTCQSNPSKSSAVGSSNGGSVSSASSFISNSDVPESRMSRLFSFRRSVGPGNYMIELMSFKLDDFSISIIYFIKLTL